MLQVPGATASSGLALECLGTLSHNRHMDEVIRKYNSFSEMKAAEYRCWQSRPVHERMDAVSEITLSLYAMKEVMPDVPRLQRTVVVLQHPRR
jgi:hypothetical protein